MSFDHFIVFHKLMFEYLVAKLMIKWFYIFSRAEDDNSKKTVIIICAVVFSCLFLALFGILFCKLRGR